MTTVEDRNELRSWAKRGVLLFGLGVLVLLGYLLAVALVPRWWAQLIGDQVDGRISVGTGYGLTLAFLLAAAVLAAFLVLGVMRRDGRRQR